jgi:hypothetical protein
MKINRLTSLSRYQKVTLITSRIVQFLAIGAATGISASPVQAISLTNSSLSFQGGTSNFFEQVNPVAGNTFSTTFNPGSIALVTGSSNSISRFFPRSPLSYTVAPAQGDFSYIGTNSNGFDYSLTNPLSFAFNNGVDLTVGAGSVFRGTLNQTTRGIDFAVLDSRGSFFSNAGNTTPTNSLAFSFGDIPDRSFGIGGGYSISASNISTQIISTQVPEPFTMIGTIFGSAAAFRMRRKLTTALNNK